MDGILALMYHAVRREGDAIPATDFPYSVAREAFVRQLDLLASHGYAPVDPDDPRPEAGGKRVLLTFDDSWASHAAVTLPILRERGLKAIFFLTTEQFGTPGMVARDEAARLAREGMVLGSHGVTHRYFDTLDEPQLLRELTESRAILSELAGREVTWLSLPGGRGHAMLAEVARDAGYTHIATSRAGLWRGEPRLPRMPVMDAMDEAAFVTMLTQPATAALVRGVRQAGKEMIRWGLGNRLYDWVREALLPRK